MAKKITQDKYRIKFVDRILDPVHGFIDLTEVESKIIALPIFKRMQSLKQLSLTNWVFPGAEHTRYMHSLGVMYVADLMASNLRDINDNVKFNDGQRQLIRLAGLLHDIGHYPLSHVTEYVYKSKLLLEENTLSSHNESIKKRIDRLALNTNTHDLEYMKSTYSKPMHHENIGAFVIGFNKEINSIINEYCPFIDIEDIKDIIVGCVENKPEISAMVQLIHSELDADGIDYIMRDSSFSGTNYGGFELGLLVRNLVVETYNNVDIVGVKPKGISIVDQYLISKYFSYTQVIFNRHVAIFDSMAEILSRALIKLEKCSAYPSEETLIKYIELHNSNEEYLKFTDRTFWTQIDTFKKVDLEGFVDDYIIKIHEKLSHYQEFEMYKDGETIITTDKKVDAHKLLSESQVYSRLNEKSSNHIALFHQRGFTSQIPELELKQILMELYNDEDENKFLSINTSRLQEGVAIISKDSSIKLLTDDPRSIMSHLYNTNTYILRDYLVK